MKTGRPTKYKKEYCKKVDVYLSEKVDKEVKVIKQVNEEKGYEMYDNKLKVQLPTIEGFAIFLEVNKTTLYEWEGKHPEFSNALDKIRTEQKERLINSGLAGDYNSTIAKLILSSNHGMKERSDYTSDDKPITVTPQERKESQDAIDEYLGKKKKRKAPASKMSSKKKPSGKPKRPKRAKKKK